MIINFIVQVVLTNIKTALNGLPTVAATPQAVVDGGQWILDTINATISVVSMVLTPTLTAACVVVIIGMFTFEWIYSSVMWVLRKLPMVNIK
jgi:hypothetical protein